MARLKAVIAEEPTEVITKRVAQESLTITERAQALTIRTDEDQMLAGEMLKAINGMQAQIDAAFDPIITSAHQAHKTAIAQKKIAEGPLVQAKAIINPKYAAFQRQQEDARRAEQERLRRIAEQEMREKAEEQRMELARQLAEQGRMDEAAQVIDEPVYVEPVKASQTYVPPVAKVAGVSVRRVWYAEVTDLRALVVAVATGKAPLNAVCADQVFLNKQATAFKDTDALGYPGVRVMDKDSVASGK